VRQNASEAMRKVSLVFLGAIAGAGLALWATQPRTVGSRAEAALSDAQIDDEAPDLIGAELVGQIAIGRTVDYV